MESKYYTPIIDEFYVGFEYERMNGLDWEKTELTNIDCCGTMARGYENEFEEIDSSIRTVRVKYLDKEDMESLGFICKYESNSIYYTYKESVSLFNSGVWTLKLINWPSEDNIRLTISDASIDDEVIFRGKIKNKSELIKLLKQIGLNE